MRRRRLGWRPQTMWCKWHDYIRHMASHSCSFCLVWAACLCHDGSARCTYRWSQVSGARISFSSFFFKDICVRYLSVSQAQLWGDGTTCLIDSGKISDCLLINGNMRAACPRTIFRSATLRFTGSEYMGGWGLLLWRILPTIYYHQICRKCENDNRRKHVFLMLLQNVCRSESDVDTFSFWT